MYKVKQGPTVYFDVDDTLVMWEPSDRQIRELALEPKTFSLGVVSGVYYLNRHNINLLKNYAVRGHEVVVWSNGGADWAECVIKTLGLEDYVAVVSGKPQIYVDDVEDVTQWMGKHQYISLEGKVARPYPQQSYEAQQ